MVLLSSSDVDLQSVAKFMFFVNVFIIIIVIIIKKGIQ